MIETKSYLYVEDDPRSRQVMALIMTNAMGVKNLTMFADSTNFLARVKALSPPPDVVLLDIQIEPYDGFEVLQLLRQDAEMAQVRVIALTASVMNEEVERLRAAGFDGAISKPLKINNFPQLMARVVAGEKVWHIA
ncbi:MAG: hypothetical protein CSA11_02510 [Chloroflexi bacterium]|nr:MAG: hypothetical protein CSB13_04525 [Chloroflexota bacterium]PIE82005.1 MAG: hypothetical protein CSA11_02510 [Chloroflexota bacterium]